MGSSIAQNAMSLAISGTITKVRYHSNHHPVTKAQKHIIFAMSESMGPCTWVYLQLDDYFLAGAVMNAKAKNMPVRIEFDETSPAPWGDPNTCALNVLDQL